MNTMTQPEAMPGLACGMTTRQWMRHHGAPRSSAASIWLLSRRLDRVVEREQHEQDVGVDQADQHAALSPIIQRTGCVDDAERQQQGVQRTLKARMMYQAKARSTSDTQSGIRTAAAGTSAGSGRRRPWPGSRPADRRATKETP